MNEGNIDMKTRTVTIDLLLEEREKCWIAEVAGVVLAIGKYPHST